MSATTIKVLWITFVILGQWSLLLLLGTFVFVKTLPQRTNPFLVNFLLTTLLSTFPPCLLFFTAQLEGEPPKWLCLTQSVLMHGIAPMCGIAWVVLVFNTWRDLKSKLLGETSILAKFPWLKGLLLLSPYVTMVIWCTASLVLGLQPSAQLRLSEFVYCDDTSVPGDLMRRFVGFFMLGIGFLEIALEICIGRLIYQAWDTVGSHHRSYHFALHILAFCICQLGPIVLSGIGSVLNPNSHPAKEATQVLESMGAFATFLVFGTQRDVLQAWKFWQGRTKPYLEARPRNPRFEIDPEPV